MIGFTTVSEPIPVFWTISSTKLRADPRWVSPSRRSRRCRDTRSVQLKAPRPQHPDWAVTQHVVELLQLRPIERCAAIFDGDSITSAIQR